MAAGQLSLNLSFGLQPIAHNNVLSVDDTTLAYPVGRHVTVVNTESRASSFLATDHFDRVHRVTAMAIAPSRKFLAVGEVAGTDELAQLSVFTVGTQKRNRTLQTPPDVNVHEWRSIAFSSDGKLIVALGDAPDYYLLYWHWERNRTLGSARVGMPAMRVAISRREAENATVAVSGPKLMRFYRAVDGQIKGANASVGKRELLDYSDQCWLSDERLVACAISGEVSVFEAQELRQVLPAVHAGSAGLHTICAFARGFIVAGERGLLSLHERTEDNAFVPLKTFVCHGAISRIAGTAVLADRRPEPITAISISPTEESLVICQGGTQVATFALKDVDILKSDGDEDHFSPLCGGFHMGAVTGLDVCARKPLAVTCSADRTVRVWSYAERQCEQARFFVEEPLSVAFHPSGYHVVVGFADKLRFFHVLVDDLKFVAEFHVKMCREVRFSNGGHFFCATAGPNVILFGTYSMEAVGTLKGHAGPVRALAFSADDLAIVTAGVDGAVYEWAVDGLARVEDHVLKSTQYSAVLCAERGAVLDAAAAGGGGALTRTSGAGGGTSAALTAAERAAARKARIVAGSGDGKLRELSAGTVTRELSVGNKLSSLALSQPDRASKLQLLFAGTSDGSLHSLRWPLDGDAPVATQALHRGATSRLRVTADSAFLFSASEDGAVFCLGLRPQDPAAAPGGGRGRAVEDGVGGGSEVDTVLVSHSDLLEKLSTVAELEKQIGDQQLQAEFKLHQREAEFAKSLKKEKDEAAVKGDDATQRYETLMRQKERAEREFAEHSAAVEVAHMRAAEELEHLYEKKLAAEAARYEALAQQKDDMQSAFEERMLAMQTAHQAQLETYRAEMGGQRALAEREAGQLKSEKDTLRESYEEELKQEERDYEEEIAALKQLHGRHLEAERSEGLKLKGEAAILRKKFEASRADMQKLRNSLEDRDREIRTLSGQLADGEKMISMLRKDMREREDTIADKERRMAELKGKNKELEKFKYVLDYKLRELKKELEPRDEAINRMRATVSELDEELQRDYRQNVALTQEVGDKHAKVDSLTRELKKQRWLLAEKERFIASFARDLHRLVTHTEPALWRDAIKDIYRTYVKADSTQDDSRADDDAAEHEIHRQRQYMERAIETLKGRVTRSEDKRTGDQRRKVGENEALLAEVNTLRVENKDLRARVTSLAANLELLEKKNRPRQSLTGAAPPTASSSAGGTARPASASRARTATAGSATEGAASLPAVGDRSGSAGTVPGSRGSGGSASGRIVHGSALARSRDRTRIAEMMSQLDENNKEINAQRAEIRRLREQVQGLLTQPQAGAS